MGRRQHPTPRTSKRERSRIDRAERTSAVVIPSTYKPQPIQRLEPKTENQRRAIENLEDGYPVNFLTGSAGTGKSMIAAWWAAKLLNSKKINKVYLVRPAVAVGKSIGLLPGEIEEKLAPYFAQTIEHFNKFLGKADVDGKLGCKTIEMQPVEYLRGRSFENCVVIIEEAQDLTHSEMEMMLTRLGEGTTFIFTGDQKQHDLQGESGLTSTIRLVNKMLQTHPEYLNSEDMDTLDEGIAIVEFTPEDVVRSGLTRALVKMYHHN